MRHAFWVLPLVLVGTAGAWLVRVRNAPPEVRFTVAAKSAIVDTLVTNGKVEPVDFAIVRAARAGVLSRLTVSRGQSVAVGQLVAELDDTAVLRQREAAEARVAQIQSELRALSSGGRAADKVEIEGQLRRLTIEQSQLQGELERVERLIQKNAATAAEARLLHDRIAAIAAQRLAFEDRRKVLFTTEDRSVLEARLAEARASVNHLTDEQSRGAIRSAVKGTVYQLDLKEGAFLNPGDPVATIGDVSRLVVKVFVDEPELGRVSPGMPAVITWDGRPRRTWNGEVRQMPRQIVPLQSRQVGEVEVHIENSDGAIPAGANVNAAIRSQEARDATVIPKECLRRDAGGQGVFVVEGGVVRWRAVKLGVANVTHVQVLEGVRAGDQVLLATETPLRDGQPVIAVPAN